MRRFKLNIHLSIFFGLVLLLPVLLYVTAEQQACLLPVISEQELELTADEPEMINFYALTCAEVDKQELTAPESKILPDAEPEAEPPKKASEENLAVTSAESTGTSQPAGTSLSQKEQQMVNLINEARAGAGLPSLKVNGQLTKAARAKSKDMVNNNYFSHQSPTYGDMAGLLRRFGITYRAAGENLAMNSNGSVTAAHHSLMGSSGHRANILNSRYSQVGVGIHTKSDGSHYYTQLFVGF